MDEDQTRLADSLHAARDHSLTEDLRQLAGNAKELAEAEYAYQKSRAAYAGGKAKWIAAAGVAAAIFAYLALMALVLGLILTLAPTLSPLGATAAVTGGLLIVSLLSIFAMLTMVRRMKSVLSDDGPN